MIFKGRFKAVTGGKKVGKPIFKREKRYSKPERIRRGGLKGGRVS